MKLKRFLILISCCLIAACNSDDKDKKKPKPELCIECLDVMSTVSDGNIPSTKEDAKQVFAALRTFSAEWTDEVSSVEKYSQELELIQEYLINHRMDDAIMAVSSTFQISLSTLKFDENQNLIAEAGALQTQHTEFGGREYILESEYTVHQHNNVTISWKLWDAHAFNTEAPIGWGTYATTGGSPMTKGDLEIEATFEDYYIESEYFSYNTNGIELSNPDPFEKDHDISVNWENLTIDNLNPRYPITATLKQLTLDFHLTTQLDEDNAESIVYESSYLEELKFIGTLTTPDAVLTGNVLLKNESRNTTFQVNRVSWNKERQLYELKHIHIPLADHLEFSGSFEHTELDHKVEGLFRIQLDPDQQIIAKNNGATTLLTLSLPYVRLECNENPYRLYAFEKIECEEGKFELGYSPKGRENYALIHSDPAPSTKPLGSITFEGNMDSFVTPEEIHYDMHMKLSRESSELAELEVKLSVNELNLRLVSDVVIHSEYDKALEAKQVLLESSNGIIVHFTDLNLTEELEDYTELGEVLNLEGEKLGTIEYIPELGYRVKYHDGEFESIF